MGAFMLTHPSVHIQQIDILNAVRFIVSSDDLKEGIPHFAYKVVPDDDEPFAEQAVFYHHLELEKNGLRGMQGIGEYKIEGIAFQPGPAVGIPNVPREIAHFLTPE